jgi:hypothetical protein
MVLEGASAPESGSFNDGTPASDLDLYDGAAQATTFRLDSRLPHPFPLFGPLLGYSQSGMAKQITQGFAAAGQLLHRPLRTEEAEALAYNIAKMERTASYGSVLGAAAGLYRAWNTAATYRFPLFQPNLETFNPNSFAMFKGPLARAVINALRAVAYGSTGMAIGGILIKSYGAVVFATTIKTDPRLKDVNEAVSKLDAMRSDRVGQNCQRQNIQHPSYHTIRCREVRTMFRQHLSVYGGENK